MPEDTNQPDEQPKALEGEVLGMPDNSYKETDNSFIFPAWGLEVSKTAVHFEPKVTEVEVVREIDGEGKPTKVDKVKHTKQVKVETTRTVEDAKLHVKKSHGIDIDTDQVPYHRGGPDA